MKGQIPRSMRRPHVLVLSLFLVVVMLLSVFMLLC